MEDPSEIADERASARSWWWAVAVVVVANLAALPLTAWIESHKLGIVHPKVKNIFYVLFKTYEPAAGAVAALLLVLIALGAWRRRVPELDGLVAVIGRKKGLILGALAVAVCAVAWLGAETVHHGFPFSMDEYGADFQARLFLSGQWAAPIDEEWRPVAKAMTPIFVGLHQHPLQWTSHYLPVYGLLKALFLALGAPALLNALCAGLSLVAVAAVARSLWPDDRAAPLLAAVLLATSAQFLVTSMTFYSMPAHLALNLFWLYLFVRDDRGSTAALPWVGVAAMGLHQFVMHSVFAAPFLAQTVLQRQWRRAAYFAGVYLGGLAVWWRWMDAMRPDKPMRTVGKVFDWPDAQHLGNQAMNLSLIFTWQSLALSVLALLALHRWRRMTWTERNLVFSCVLTFGFYVFYTRNQGHGWGYRYFYPVLGNVALLAVLGWPVLKRALGRHSARGFLAAGLVVALLIQIPWRVMEVETTIRPFAQVFAQLQTSDKAVLVVDADSVWYGSDLIRNDPLFAQGPRLLRLKRLKRSRVPDLLKREDVGLVPGQALAAAGLVPAPAKDQVLPGGRP